jgi:hypothetical protein
MALDNQILILCGIISFVLFFIGIIDPVIGKAKDGVKGIRDKRQKVKADKHKSITEQPKPISIDLSKCDDLAKYYNYEVEVQERK